MVHTKSAPMGKRNSSEVMVVIFTVFSLVIMGCATPKSALDAESSGDEQIPENFDPAKGVLLIEQSIEDSSSVALSTSVSVKTDAYTNYYMKKNKKEMREYAEKNYPYKHEFTSQADIYSSNSRYKDKQIYQFALVTTVVKPPQYTKVYSDGNMKPTNYQPIFRFYLYDRLNNKTYSSLGKGSSLIMWAYKNAIKKIKEGKK